MQGQGPNSQGRTAGWCRAALAGIGVRRLTARLSVAGFLLVGLGFGASAASAASLSWSPARVLDPTGTFIGDIASVACPSASQCTAVDEYGQEVTYNPAAPGTPAPATIDPGNGLVAVACPSTAQCTAVDYVGNQVTFNPTAPGTATPTTIDGTDTLSGGVACPSVTQCTAADASGRVVTFNPTAPASPTTTSIDTEAFEAVACPTASQCTAVDDAEDEVTFDPVAPGAPTPVAIDTPGSQGPPFSTAVFGLACPTAAQCTAVDSVGAEVTFNPVSPGSPNPTTIDSGGGLGRVACVAVTQCTASDESGGEVTFNPESPSVTAPTTVNVPGYALDSVACPSVSECTGVDDNSREVTFNPASPTTATRSEIDSSSYLSAVACPSASECTAVDGVGREVTFNPSAAGSGSPVVVDSGADLTGVACPSTSQCTAVDTGGREVTFNPVSPGTPTPSAVDPGGFLDAVACASASQCTVVDRSGREVTFNPTAPGTPTPSVIDNDGFGLVAVSCPSASQCTAVDYGLDEVTFNPAAPGTPTPRVIDNTDDYLSGVACPSTSQCTAIDGVGQQVTFNPTAPGTTTPVAIDSGVYYGLGAIACPTTTLCIGVDHYGRTFMGDPTSTSKWPTVAVAGANSLTAAACSSVAQCVVVDRVGNAFVGTSAQPAPVNTALPVISGTLQDAQTLTTTTGTWSSPDTLAFAYQWQRCTSTGSSCTSVAGATASSYKLSSADVRDEITVVVSATDSKSQTTHATANSVGPIPVPAPPANTVLPVISGTIQDGQTLSTTTGTWTSPDALTFQYQWQRCSSTGTGCTNVAGATAGTYKLSSADVGDEIAVVVSATDKESQTTAATARAVGPVPIPAPPANSVLPVISGTAQDGQTLTTTTGTWSSPDALAFQYQWQRCSSTGASCTSVTGAAASTYKLSSADVGDEITVVVSATDKESQTTQATARAVGPVAAPAPPGSTALPVISGTAQDGQTLSTTTGTWSSPDTLAFGYQWQRCSSTGTSCTSVAGATASTYKLSSADFGGEVTVVVSATDKESQTTPATARPVGPVLAPAAPTNSAVPVISGTVQDGQTLTTTNGTWSSPDALVFGYQWQRCSSTGTSCASVTGATASSYKLSSADVGDEVTVVVSAIDKESQTTQAPAEAVGPVPVPAAPVNSVLPLISGTVQDGQILSTTTGTWTSPDALAFQYQWERCSSTGTSCANVTGATASSYKLSSADVGDEVTVVVSATDKENQTTPATARTVGPIPIPAPPANTALPVISGTVQDGQTLATSNGSWSSPDGLGFRYQWQRCSSTGTSCANVTGAKFGSYKLSSADVGDEITVVISATDDENQTGQATATPTGQVAVPAPPADTAPPVISGTVQDGQTLTTTNGTWSSPDGLAFQYQWQRCTSTGTGCVKVVGAKFSSYTLSSADVGDEITVVVSATDDENQTAQATATPTVAVPVPAPPANTVLPVISGTMQDGQTLTTTTGTWSSPDLLVYRYQWQRCSSTGTSCTNVVGAKFSSYTLSSADVGDEITVVVSATDDENQTTQATAKPAGPVTAPAPPANTALPTISGTVQDGQTLTASTGTWSSPDPLAYAYQWQRCTATGTGCANMSGATSTTYKLSSADVGDEVTAVVSATDKEGRTGQATAKPAGPVAAPAAPANTALPVISGTVQDGQTLTTTNGTWSSPDGLAFQYQWQLCSSTGTGCAKVVGAKFSSYKLSSADVGDEVTVVVIATDDENQTGQATATPVGPVPVPAPPASTVVPLISGTVQDGQPLTTTNGTWSSPDALAFQYQWQRCTSTGTSCTNVAGAKFSSYTLSSADVGDEVTVLVRATDDESQTTQAAARPVGAVPVPSPPTSTALPVISGTVQAGQTLTTTNGAWSSPDQLAYRYQWQRCSSTGTSCANVVGAKFSSYSLSTADVGSEITVVISATDDENQTGQATAAPTGPATVTPAKASRPRSAVPSTDGGQGAAVGRASIRRQ
jgi:hypothetical protein